MPFAAKSSAVADGDDQGTDEATAELLDVAESMAVGADLVTVCAEIAGEPLGPAGAVRLDALLERCVSWLTSVQMQVKATAFDHSADTSYAAIQTVAELATASAVSELSMGRTLNLALGVVRQLPACRAALAAGQLTVAHARELDRVLGLVDPELAGTVDRAVTDLAVQRGWTPHQLRKAAERTLLRIDPDGCQERAAVAKWCESDVRYRTVGDGLATVTATGDQVVLRQVADAIDLTAAALVPEGGEAGRPAIDGRTPGELRVLALAESVLGAEQVAKPTVEVLLSMSVETVLGLDDTPADVAGVGAVPAPLARTLANDAMWRRMLTDPLTGQTLDLGSRAYRPSRRLRRLVAARDMTCRFPGCTRRGCGVDIDHIENFPIGGTDAGNLHVLCRKHHNLKTHGGWRVVREPDGRETWTSPLGFDYVNPAPRWSLDELDLPEPPEPPDPPWWVPDDTPTGLPLYLGPDDPRFSLLFADSQEFDPTGLVPVD